MNWASEDPFQALQAPTDAKTEIGLVFERGWVTLSANFMGKGVAHQ